ncbi:non-canonical poly(A) RNA polymerase PAPD5 isoform X1 [Canna indica]|uniref:CMP-2-keto-3-deoxyoctulosonic acid synthase n=1 Tax=Canna indica TaxID=4628 RepID=A0AAQ3QMA3_9LILI|nr:non-canonical poly(A) RNA polymerase PAPD5 isoform X1 [Canna indica]
MEESGSFLYDTFGSLVFSAEYDPEPAESYAVFRNHITSSADCFAEIPVIDYLSLDVDTASELPEPLEATLQPSAPRTVDGAQASELVWFAGSRFRSPMLQLHKEILDFCDFISPTPAEQASRSAAVQCISEIIKHIWPQCKVEVFGSFRTGLYLPTSDIDVVIMDSEVKSPQMGLYALARALSQRSVAKKMQVIAKARVPIIKFVEKRSGIAFDVSFDIDSGPAAADYIKGAVQKLPPLRPLCLVLKVFLQQRELNEVYSGGIGSYALLVMLIVYLQFHWKGQNSQDHHQPMERNLGILLAGFFDFFGRKLNNWDVGISCNSKKIFFIKDDKGFLNSEKPYLLSIEDPQAPENDIAKNSYNYYKVRSAFSTAYSILTDAKAVKQLGPQRSILGMIIRPDSVLLDRKGGDGGQLTFSNVLSGAGEPIAQHFDNGNDVIYNWQLVDDDPLPREKLSIDDDNISSFKRRKSKNRSGRREKLEDLDSKHREMSNGNASGVKRRKKIRDRDRSTNISSRNWDRDTRRVYLTAATNKDSCRPLDKKGSRSDRTPSANHLYTIFQLFHSSMAICASSSESSSSSSGTKSWVAHAAVLGAAIAAAAGAHFYLYPRFSKFRSRVVGIIPARFASSRFEGKPLVQILGKPMIQRTWERAKLASTLENVVVATDDEKIAECCRGFGADVVMTSVGCRNGTERCNEALQKLGKDYDIVVNIQGDEPLIEPEIIDGIVKALQGAPDAVFSTAVTSLKPEDGLDPNRVKCVVDNRGYAIYFSRGLIPFNKSGKVNPQFPYLLHLGIQSYDAKFLKIYPQLPPTPLQLEEDLEQLKVLENGYKMKVIKVNHDAHGVDTPEDVQKIESLMRERNIK